MSFPGYQPCCEETSSASRQIPSGRTYPIRVCKATHSKKKDFRSAQRGDIYGLAVENWEARSITPDLSTIPSFWMRTASASSVWISLALCSQLRMRCPHDLETASSGAGGWRHRLHQPRFSRPTQWQGTAGDDLAPDHGAAVARPDIEPVALEVLAHLHRSGISRPESPDLPTVSSSARRWHLAVFR